MAEPQEEYIPFVDIKQEVSKPTPPAKKPVDEAEPDKGKAENNGPEEIKVQAEEDDFGGAPRTGPAAEDEQPPRQKSLKGYGRKFAKHLDRAMAFLIETIDLRHEFSATQRQRLKELEHNIKKEVRFIPDTQDEAISERYQKLKKIWDDERPTEDQLNELGDDLDAVLADINLNVSSPAGAFVVTAAIIYGPVLLSRVPKTVEVVRGRPKKQKPEDNE